MFVPGKIYMPFVSLVLRLDRWLIFMSLQILKPAEKKQKYVYGGLGASRPVTPPRKQKK